MCGFFEESQAIFLFFFFMLSTHNAYLFNK